MGHDLNLAEIYPKVEFPVSRGTPMISSLIKMNRSRTYQVPNYSDVKRLKGFQKFSIESESVDWSFIQGHVIDGILFSLDFIAGYK